MRNRNDVLVVVPTVNEAENLDELISGIFRHCPGADLLFVDDGSTDGSREIMRRRREAAPDGKIQIIERPRKLGLGTAYLQAFRHGLDQGYSIFIEMDADQSHDPGSLPEMLRVLERSSVAVGSRYVQGGGTRNWGILRKLVSRFGSTYARAILGLKVQDLTGGFNGWHRRVLKAIDLDEVKSEGYSFQIELKYRAARLGFDIQEFPIVFVDRKFGQSKMSSRIVVEAMSRVVQLRLRLGGRIRDRKLASEVGGSP